MKFYEMEQLGRFNMSRIADCLYDPDLVDCSLTEPGYVFAACDRYYLDIDAKAKANLEEDGIAYTYLPDEELWQVTWPEPTHRYPGPYAVEPWMLDDAEIVFVLYFHLPTSFARYIEIAVDYEAPEHGVVLKLDYRDRTPTTTVKGERNGIIAPPLFAIGQQVKMRSCGEWHYGRVAFAQYARCDHEWQYGLYRHMAPQPGSEQLPEAHLPDEQMPRIVGVRESMIRPFGSQPHTS